MRVVSLCLFVGTRDVCLADFLGAYVIVSDRYVFVCAGVLHDPLDTFKSFKVDATDSMT